jgi:ubiquinone/menaquinone biosynthesis C-methylase UbiE
MGREFSERFVWAAKMIDPRPGEELLEIGCGHGELIDVIATRESRCRITAIDRSAKMTAAAARRNADHIALGNVRVEQCELLRNPFESHSFDKAFVYNMNVFWMDPAAELGEIRRILKPKGKFYLFHRPPPGCDPAEYAAAFRQNLENACYRILDETYNLTDKVNAVGIVSTPA